MTEQTSAPKKSRRQLLEEIVAQKPNDAFSRYGLALECDRDGDASAADENFRALIERNPDYIPGFQMYGQFLVREERKEEARKILTAGMAAASKAGNQHARSEMEALLDELN
ncbi:MAG TPA: hypothetical protein VMH48_01190 [Methylomirabilota bacterium]|nr:hypothetical protein [Methylomirabilota bacterium]